MRRCELVSGDKIAGPVRAPRRSERYPSLIRIDTINGRPADEVAEGTPFDELPCGFPTERFALGYDDATLKAIEWLTPFGRGSRVIVTGGPRAGKTEALRRLAGALGAQEGLEVCVVLVGVRPEEIGDWSSASFSRSPSSASRRARRAGPGGRARDRHRQARRRARRPRRRPHRHARRTCPRRSRDASWPPPATSSTAAR